MFSILVHVSCLPSPLGKATEMMQLAEVYDEPKAIKLEGCMGVETQVAHGAENGTGERGRCGARSRSDLTQRSIHWEVQDSCPSDKAAHKPWDRQASSECPPNWEQTLRDL